MAAIAVGLVAFGTSAIAVTVLLAFWGLIATAAPVGWWTWMSKVLPDQAEAGGGLMVAVIQLAITVGASVGGLLFDGSGYRATFGASAVILGLLSRHRAHRSAESRRARRPQPGRGGNPSRVTQRRRSDASGTHRTQPPQPAEADRLWHGSLARWRGVGGHRPLRRKEAPCS